VCAGPDRSDGTPDRTIAAKTLLILGASGDLTARLLLPGLGGLIAAGGAEGLLLVGSGADDWDDAHWREQIAESFAAAGAAGAAADAVVAGALYRSADATSEDDLRALLAICEEPAVIYFALPPAVTAEACAALTRIGVPDSTRLVLEKPFGTDLAGARALNGLVTSIVPEGHVHRVDHVLGMSTVLNIVGLRFANRILEPVLNSEHVAAVDVVFDEALGLEGRGGYYDGAGALVDMIQSHLLQVLSVMVMEAPPTLGERGMRARRADVLRAVRVWDDEPVACSRRARYTAGSVAGRELPSYVDEEDVDPARMTETFAEVVVAVATWRWSGVPFRLRSGKAIGSPRQEVTITFKDPPLLPAGFTGYERPDRLRIGIAPGAGRLCLEISVNGPGDPLQIDPTNLIATFGAGELPEYGEVLKGVLAGDPSLSVRGDMAEECWRIVAPVLDAWDRDEVPMQQYEAGSDGPGAWRGRR
jgi:glucose-6-phosphate 1-dehydrogenase